MALTKPTTTQTTAQEVQAPDEVAQPEEQVDAPAPAEQEEATTESRAVAEAPKAAQPVASSQFETSMAEQGFDGLTLGGMSFEQIRLPGEGQFLIGQEDQELGKEFDCVIQNTRSRYVVRQSNEEEAEMFYSYDPKGLTDSEGNDMSEKLQEWREDGYDKPVIKRYIEAMAIMVNAGERDGMMVMLSIPPASVQKFAGFIAQQQFMRKQLPSQYITRCVVGKKVKRDGGSSFFPWSFQNAGPAPQDLF